MCWRNSGFGKLDHPEGDLGVAGELAAMADLRLGARKAGAFMHQGRGELQGVAGLHESAQLGLLEGGEERHARESGDADDEPARGLRHAFEQQHAGHQRKSGKMALEDRGSRRHGGLGADGAGAKVELNDPIDQLEVFEAHAAGFMRPWRPRARRYGHRDSSGRNTARWWPCPRSPLGSIARAAS